MEWQAAVENPVLHVVVVGFHHKKGCQVEYSYPPLIDGKSVDNNECPEDWKHLPSLALPDGAHNFTEDTVYFHLPSRTEPKSTVFGVSCYRQIDSTELLNRGTDVTRNTVQKSVCVLSRLPVFGLIQAKLQLITHAYFKGRDFSQVALLEDTYRTLNLSMTDSLLNGSQVFLGLSCRELLHQFQHKILVLFKLMLLERRVLFYSSPVKPICTSLLTIISLFPGMIEHGLAEAASYSSKYPTSALNIVECDDYLAIQYQDDNSALRNSARQSATIRDDSSFKHDEKNLDTALNCQQSGLVSQSTFYMDIIESINPSCDKLDIDNSNSFDSKSAAEEKLGIFGSCPRKLAWTSKKTDKSINSIKDTGSSDESFSATECSLEDLLDKDDELTWKTDKLLLEISEALDDEAVIHSAELNTSTIHSLDSVVQATLQSKGTNEPSDCATLVSSVSEMDLNNAKLLELAYKNHDSFEQPKSVNYGLISSVELTTTFPVDDFGFPLSIFTKGMLCHPYLSLHLYEILNDINVRGFVIGATNALFKQKAYLTDVVIELSDLKIDIHDNELKKQLALTTADLRFAEHLVRSIGEEKGDIYLDDTEWEGGDDWLRSQFKSYLLSLLATVSHGDEKLIEDFNSSFAAAWKTTHNYKQWKSCHHPGMAQIPLEHPFHGQLSIADFRMRLNQVIQQADRNKKINAVVNQTGKVVSQTGKVVGDAFTSAKSAMTTWFGSIGGSKS